MTNRVAPVSKCLFTVLSHACESTRVEMPDGGPAGTALVFLGTAGENGPVHIRRSTDPDSFFSFSSSWQDKKCGIYSPDIILSLKSPLFGYPTTYSSSVTQNRKRTKGWLSPNRRRSRVTACRSDRHAFETPYVVNSGVHHRWTNNFVDLVEHPTPAPLDHSFVWRARVPCSGIVACRRSYSIALRSICTELLFIRSCDESKVQR